MAYNTIRSSFHEGVPVYPESNFTTRFYTAICVSNPEMIIGYYLPLPVHRYNPFLKKDFW
jgi:hypothetical protein